MLVHKYRGYSDRSLEILLNRKLYFSPIEQLNDPLDATINIRAGFLEALENCPPTDKLPLALRPVMLRGLNTYKYYKPDEGQIGLYELIQRFIASNGILSLSANITDPLLWAHYSDGHTGFALGFESEMLWPEQKAHKGLVQYSTEPIVQSTFLQIADEFFRVTNRSGIPLDFTQIREAFLARQANSLTTAALFAKSSNWQYEQEYRIASNPPGNRSFNPAALKTVVFGLKILPERISAILAALRAPDFSHVAVHKVRRRGNSYLFEVVPYNAEA